jgi:hypothetical protein
MKCKPSEQSEMKTLCTNYDLLNAQVGDSDSLAQHFTSQFKLPDLNTDRFVQL